MRGRIFVTTTSTMTTTAIKRNTKMAPTLLFFFALPCPAIWSRRYSYSFFLHYAMFEMLSSFGTSSVIGLSLVQAYVYVGLAALFFFPQVCPRLASQHVLLFHTHHVGTSCVVLYCSGMRYSRFPSTVFSSDRIPPCHASYPPQHPHLIYFQSCVLSFHRCPVSAPYNRAVVRISTIESNYLASNCFSIARGRMSTPQRYAAQPTKRIPCTAQTRCRRNTPTHMLLDNSGQSRPKSRNNVIAHWSLSYSRRATRLLNVMSATRHHQGKRRRKKN